MSTRNIGIDLGVTSKHKADIRDDRGKKIGRNFSLSTTKEDLDALSRYALKDAPEETKLRFIFEATSMIWLPIALYGKSEGHEVVRVKTQQAHDLRKYYSRHGKSDKIDAKTLAKMPVVDEEALEEVFIPDKRIFALDRRSRQKNKITETIAGLKKRISSFFHWVIPGLLDCFENRYGEVARAFYRQYANPFRAKESGLEGLTLFLKGAGNEDLELPQKLYQAVLRACELYQDALEYVDFDELQNELIEELDHLEERERALARVNAQIERLYEEVHPSKNLETISGIRDGLAPEFIGIIGDPHRFSSNSKLVGYSGMYPEQDESGERSKKGLSITKEGPPRMRRAAYIASDIARQWDPQLAKLYYDQMVHKGNCHTQALCAIAPHLLARVLTVLKEDRPYELRDPDGNPISKRDAKLLIEREYTVPEEVRERTRSRRRKQRRQRGGRTTHTNESRQSRS